MLLVAREVAFVRLLDTGTSDSGPAASRTGWLRKLLGLAS
jgi:hypothetical protein